MQARNSRLALILAASVLILGSCSLLKNFQTPDDNAITSAIQSKLFQDPVLKTRDIRVTSQKGVVVLTGTVASENEKASAEQVANSVSGVKQVIDQLTVAPSSAATEAATESVAPERPRVESPRSRRHRERSEAAQPPTPQASAQPAPPRAPAPAAAPAPPPPPRPVQYTISAGTDVTVQMIDPIDSSKNHAGDEFAATIASPIVVGDKVVVPQNSDARVRLVETESSGHFKGQSELKVELISITAGGNPYQVETNTYQKLGQARGKRSAETIGGGAGLGALIGAIAGHGKGAAIGAAVGAGAGTAVQAATKAPPVVIPSETKIDFTLKNPVTVTLNP